jgi:hypothetical protein
LPAVPNAVPLCKAYRVTKVWGDNYAGEYAKEPFRKAGIFYDLWSQHKSELYRDPLLPLINSKRITLPRIDRLINQCCQLERSVKRSGRDEISHPTHARDDVINAAAGVAAVVSRKAFHKQPPIVQPAIWSKSSGWLSDPSGNRAQTTTQKFYEYYNSGGGSYWPGSGPREW